MKPNPKLKGEVAQALADAAAWTTSHAILQRCASAHDKDDVVRELHALMQAGEAHSIHGTFGLLYALPSVAKPVAPAKVAEAEPGASEVDGAGEAVQSTQTDPSNGLASVRAAAVMKINKDTRERMIELFRLVPLRPARDFIALLGKSQPIVSGYLRAMEADRLVERVGKGTGIRYRFLGSGVAAQVEPAPLALAVAPAPKLASMVRPRKKIAAKAIPTPAPRAASTIRFAAWNDGALVIDQTGAVTNLDPLQTRDLYAFLGSMAALLP